MLLRMATEPGSPGWPNEDYVCAAPGAAVLLDGATTVPRDAGTGCVHGVAWFARTLATTLLAEITAPGPAPLAGALASAIALVRDRHSGTCDLTAQRTPAATVTAVRAGPGGFAYLALADSSVVLDYADGRPPRVITDTHRAARADPGAASGAVTGTVPAAGIRGVVLLSDGATRIVDRYEVLSWPEAIGIVRDQGPEALIREVRAAEAGDPDAERWPRHKLSDDATVLYWPCTP